MRLHHQPRTRSTRVLWLLEELGVPFDLAVMSGDHKQTPEYRSLHPLGRSPALETADGPLFESAALVIHLADLNLEKGLIGPLGSYERGLHYQWSFFAMTECEPPLSEIARQIWQQDREPDAGIIERAAARFVAAIGAVVESLGDDEYLVNDTFSVADIIVCSALAFARTGKVTELPEGIVDYIDRLEARPAWQRAAAVALPS